MTALLTDPVFKFRFSPTTNPLDTPVWVDITPYVIDFQSKFGRQFELNRFETGQATFTLDNTDRRFDPTNTASPYYPNLLPMKKFQCYAPNTVPVNAGSPLTVTSQAAGTGSAGYVVTDTPATYSNGLYTAARVQAPSTLLSVTQGWVALRVQMGWGNSGEPGGGAAFPSFFEWGDDGNNRIALNYDEANNRVNCNRRSGGTGVATAVGQNVNTNDVLTIIFTWTATTLALSINGSAFTTGSNTTIPTLAATTVNIGTDLTGANPIESTVLWFACGTGTLSNADAATIASLPNALTIWSSTNTQPVGDASMMLWPSQAAMTSVWAATSSTYRVPSDAYVFTGYVDQWPMKWEGPGWAEVDCQASDALEILAQADIVSGHSSYTTAQGSNKDLTFTSVGIGSGNNLINIAYNDNGTNPPTVTLSDQVSIIVNIQGGITTANAIMSALNADPNASLLITTSLAPGSTGVGTPAGFTAQFLSGGTFGQQLTGARINAVLDAISWPAGDRVIDAGQVNVAAQTFKALDHQKARSQINDVEASEGIAYMYANAQGFIVFHDRSHRATATRSTITQAIFGDVSSELEYDSIVPSYDNTYIFNDIEVTPLNSTTTQIASDSTSITQYTTRTYSVTTLLTSASDALYLAQYLLNIYKQPGIRFTSMQFTPMNDVGLWLQAFSRDIGDRITVNRRPPHYGTSAGPTISIDSFVESISWKMNPGLLDVTVAYEMSPSSVMQSYFVLDDATFGVLDSGYILAI